MYYILAANGETEGWLQLIVFIIIGLVYGLSALFKSRVDSAEQQETEQEPPQPRRTPRKPVEPESDYNPRITRSRQRPKPKPEYKQKQKRKPASSETSKIREDKPKERWQGGVDKNEFQLSNELDRNSPSSSTQGKIYGGGKKAAESTEEGGFSLDMPDKTDLQRAIIHYEIFGKPTSLKKDDRQDF
jgi:outer membrane biosynthesis protein TonB